MGFFHEARVMAGPWIKLEYATIRKLEITKIADTLKVSRREAFAMCFEFWCWCDAELEMGHIMHTTLEQLDATTGLPTGFCEAMRQAGWLLLEDDRIIVVNFDRHLGQSAKTRSSNARRQSDRRSRKPARKRGPRST